MSAEICAFSALVEPGADEDAICAVLEREQAARVAELGPGWIASALVAAPLPGKRTRILYGTVERSS